MGIRSPSSRTPIVDAWSDVPLVNTVNEATPAILACLAGLGRCQLLAGRYIIDPTLTTLVNSGLIYGAGMLATEVRLLPTITGIGIRMGSNSELRDLTVIGNSDAITTAVAPVSGGSTANIRLSRVRMSDCQFGFADNGVVTGAEFDRCEWEGNDIALRTNAASVGLFIRGGRVWGGQVGDTGFEFQGTPVGGSVSGVYFDSLVQGVQLSSARDFTVVGNAFSSSVAAPIPVPGGIRNEIGINRSASGVIDVPTLIVNTQNTHLGRYYRSSEPNAGAWRQGDLVFNRSLSNSPSLPWGWACRTAGDFSATPPVFEPLYRGRQEIHAHYTHTFGSIVSGASEVVADIPVSGAALGDWVDASIEAALPAGFQLHAVVTGTNVVRAQLSNIGGATTTLGEVTIHLLVRKHA